jgi:hypothetical protein
MKSGARRSSVRHTYQLAHGCANTLCRFREVEGSFALAAFAGMVALYVTDAVAPYMRREGAPQGGAAESRMHPFPFCSNTGSAEKS